MSRRNPDILYLLSFGLKKCSGCGETKPISGFQKDRRQPCGFHSHCKSCQSKYQRSWRQSPKGIASAEKNRATASLRKNSQLKASPRLSLAKKLRDARKRRPNGTTVTIEELMDMWTKQGGLCAISRVPMTLGGDPRTKRARPTSVTIDRIDSNGEYTASNARLVCYQINAFKNEWSDAKMLEMAKAIVAHMEESAPPPGLLSLLT